MQVEKGLKKAIDKFDPSRGYRFSTCAFPWIRGEITDAFKNSFAAKREKKQLPKPTSRLFVHQKTTLLGAPTPNSSRWSSIGAV